MKHIKKFNESNKVSKSDIDFLVRKIRDRIINNVGIQEFVDEEPQLKIDDCINIIQKDLEDFFIKK